MLWWDREGKNLNVDQDVQDAEEFKKAKCLAQLWQKTNMPRKHKEQASKEIKNLLQWMRKKNKNFDLDAVQSEKAEDVRKVFHAWGGKKNRKPKSIAKKLKVL